LPEPLLWREGGALTAGGRARAQVLARMQSLECISFAFNPSLEVPPPPSPA